MKKYIEPDIFTAVIGTEELLPFLAASGQISDLEYIEDSWN